MQHQHHPITRLQVAGFLATSLLLGASLWTAFLFTLIGSPLEAACGVAGIFIAGHLCRVGRKRWNFDEIDAAGSVRLSSSYIYDGETDTAYCSLLELLADVRNKGWVEMDLGEKSDARETMRNILQKHPILAEEVLDSDAPEHLRYLAEQFLPEHALEAPTCG